ncbi:hypothetical protein Ccrd_024074 [Cynara cardunculus var. scolymus]|uniref:Pentatricopeptide repeat-containing protein n=1 Tax=Cynara cardunculus var. scolymus TaxID=59895 RepID=A0A103DPE0_CYNCS|nr:hypothetical protein Ccrd_024074 [Cynara cardunculus var. scolymus]
MLSSQFEEEKLKTKKASEMTLHLEYMLMRLVMENGEMMQSDKPNPITFAVSSHPNLKSCITTLQSSASNTNLQHGKKLHFYMLINGFFTAPISITSLINMYSNSSSKCELNIFVYNAIIVGFIFNDMPNLTLRVYEKMRMSGVMIDKFTFPCVVKAFSGCRDVEGFKIVHGLVFNLVENSSLALKSPFFQANCSIIQKPPA